MKSCKTALFAGAAMVLLSACSDSTKPASATQSTTVASTSAVPPAGAVVQPPTPDVHPEPLAVPPIDESASALARPIDQAAWTTAPVSPEAKHNALIRAEVLLARAHFSPGVIDGQDGGNLKNAVAAYQTAHDLPADGAMNDQVWDALSKDSQPALTDYTITPEDEKGPFLAKIPTDEAQMAKLTHLGFTSPVEELAEKFHMDEALLKSLNPDADFTVAGTKIVVAALGPDKLPATVTRIEVDKSRRQVRAYGEGSVLLAVYPATVGSTERPAPSGDWAVRTVAINPTYTYMTPRA